LESEGVSEAAATSVEASKQEARSMLEAGSTIEEIAAATGLGRNQILGLKGSLIKAQKRLATEAKAPSENLGEEQINTDLNTDLKREAQITANAVVLARGQQRLKALDPAAYQALHGPGQSETSPGKLLTDIEFARYLRSLREESHQNNGDSNSRVSEMQRELNDLKDKLAKKDIENLTKQTDDLRQEVKELRADIHGSAGAQSDLAIVVKESKDLLSQVISHDGPLRAYLMPDNVPIGKKADAPLLHAEPSGTSATLVEGLRKYGLVTRKGD
jgi:hypothetical protein